MLYIIQKRTFLEKPLVYNYYRVEKMLGKGGWSYVVISGIPPEKKARLGLIRVQGFIDT